MQSLCAEMCLHIMCAQRGGRLCFLGAARQRTTQRLPRPFVSAALAIAGHSMPHYSGAEHRDDDDVVCSLAAAGKSRSGRALTAKSRNIAPTKGALLCITVKEDASFCVNYLNYGLWLSCHGYVQKVAHVSFDDVSRVARVNFKRIV
jgi:hypothetical protein